MTPDPVDMGQKVVRLRQDPVASWALVLLVVPALALPPVGHGLLAVVIIVLAGVLALVGPTASVTLRVDATRIHVDGWSGRWLARPFRFSGALHEVELEFAPVPGTEQWMLILRDGDRKAPVLPLIYATRSEVRDLCAAIAAAQPLARLRYGRGPDDVPDELGRLGR